MHQLSRVHLIWLHWMAISNVTPIHKPLYIIIMIHFIYRCLSQHSRAPYKTEIKTKQKNNNDASIKTSFWRHGVLRNTLIAFVFFPHLYTNSMVNVSMKEEKARSPAEFEYVPSMISASWTWYEHELLSTKDRHERAHDLIWGWVVEQTPN